MKILGDSGKKWFSTLSSHISHSSYEVGKNSWLLPFVEFSPSRTIIISFPPMKLAS